MKQTVKHLHYQTMEAFTIPYYYITNPTQPVRYQKTLTFQYASNTTISNYITKNHYLFTMHQTLPFPTHCQEISHNNDQNPQPNYWVSVITNTTNCSIVQSSMTNVMSWFSCDFFFNMLSIFLWDFFDLLSLFNLNFLHNLCCWFNAITPAWNLCRWLWFWLRNATITTPNWNLCRWLWLWLRNAIVTTSV